MLFRSIQEAIFDPLGMQATAVAHNYQCCNMFYKYFPIEVRDPVFQLEKRVANVKKFVTLLV